LKLARLKYDILKFLRAFFPLQLLFAHIKYNLFSIFFWVILFSIASDGLGSSFGIPYLFYSPEYRGETNNFSFFLIGFAIGGFTIAFHIYSYVKMCKKYPFLLTIDNSFIKFCINNSIIPFVFLVFFINKFTQFQINEEFTSTITVLWFVFYFIVGFISYILISFLYFFPNSNRNFSKNYATFYEDRIESLFLKKINWSEYFSFNKNRRYIYFCSLYKVKLSSKIDDLDKLTMNEVYRKSKISASMFELTTIIVFLLIGIYRENSLLDLPAGMSIIMLFAIIKMIYSALYSWLNYWTFPVLIMIFLFLNFMSKNTPYFQYKNYAYGMSYKENHLKKYNYQTIDSINSEMVNKNQSKRNYIKTLNRWKINTKKKKPKLIIILTSGGGSRSAFWTFKVMSHLDKEFDYQISKNTQMITGASGGMIGAAYYRSILLNYLNGNVPNTTDPKYLENISKDLLNKLSFSAYSNDFLFRIQSFNIDSNNYTKDRGYSFEQHLDLNTEGMMNNSLNHFIEFEQDGVIPTMIFSPTIVNDGRRLLISSQNLSFLCSGFGSPSFLNNMNENIDFQTFFNGNTDIRFLSVLRASATFPLVLPMISMPTSPEINLMDAGIRDNYGVKVAYEYLFSLQQWINENTSGVILLKIRDTKKVLDGEGIHKISLAEKFTLPFGNMYRNFTRTQDFDQDELMKIASYSFNFPIDLIEFNLRETSKDRISLSWHLTKQEKNKILNAIHSKSNQLAMKKLQSLIK
jgi:hypothetical protein